MKINDKHFEIIVRQMMRKVEIDEPGDTRFLEQQVVDKQEFMEENDRIWGKKVVVDSGDSQNLQPGQIVTARKLRDENSMLKRRDLKPVEVRDAIPATSTQILQGTYPCRRLGTSKFHVCCIIPGNNESSYRSGNQRKSRSSCRSERNVIIGKHIPAGTGMKKYRDVALNTDARAEAMLAEELETEESAEGENAEVENAEAVSADAVMKVWKTRDSVDG